MSNANHKTTESDHLDTIRSGITDAYEALCELAEAGDKRAAQLLNGLVELFELEFVSYRRHVGHGLYVYPRRAVVGAVDAMAPEVEHDDAPHVADGIELAKEVF